MKDKASPRKIVFFVCLIVMLMGAFSVSGYYYVMNRFSSHIVEAVETVMDGFTPEELEALVNDEEIRALLQDWQADRDGDSSFSELSIDADNVADFFNDDDPDGGSASGSNVNRDNNGSAPNEAGDSNNVNSNETPSNITGPGNGSSSSPSIDNPSESEPEKDKKDTAPENDEQKQDNNDKQVVTVPGLDSSMANKIGAKDSVFLLQIYRRFSAPEREELMSLYREGGNNSIIKEQVKSRLSGAELERLVGIGLKILD